jgi:hypothetical protein
MSSEYIQREVSTKEHSLGTLQMLALVHRETSRSTAESVALGTEFTAMAHFAEQLAFVLRTVCRVEQFATETTFEAHLVPLQTTSHTFFCGVDRFTALGALGVLDWLEVRHFVFSFVIDSLNVTSKSLKYRMCKERVECVVSLHC